MIGGMTTGKRQPKTAADLMAELAQDPEYVEGHRNALAQDEVNRRRYHEAAGPVLDNLAAVGFPVQTVGQLRHLGVEYSAAIPVLIRWMTQVDYSPVREDIVRSLAVPWAVEAAPALLTEFQQGDPSLDPPDTSWRWVVGLALSAMANPALADELTMLAADRRWGAARGMIVQELARTGDPRVPGILIALLSDETVSTDAVIGLGKLADPATRPALERFLTHPDSWVRNEAKKAVRRIDRAARAGHRDR